MLFSPPCLGASSPATRSLHLSENTRGAHGRQRLDDAYSREKWKLGAEDPGRGDYRLAYIRTHNRVHPELEYNEEQAEQLRLEGLAPEPLALTWY